MSLNQRHPVPVGVLPPEDVFTAWLETFSVTMAKRSREGFVQLFESDGYWRDILSFTWERRIFNGQSEIRQAFDGTDGLAGMANIRRAENRAGPRYVRRFGQYIVEGWFNFDGPHGTGAGFVRLAYNESMPRAPKVWILLTTLYELYGYEEKTDRNRPSGEHYSKIERAENHADERRRDMAYEDRDPEVIIVGAGQGGLILAARLRQMGVDTLIVEKSPRVGDVWRNRYSSLTLHNKLTANHFPYLPFPTTWPVWLPKDMFADWLESYARLMELNVWTGTTLDTAKFDETSQTWDVALTQEDGRARKFRPRHIVMSTGVSGGTPRRPKLQGLSEFAGTVLHSSEFKSSKEWAGRNALVIGTGNSGHDIAQELYVAGARSVSLMQRGPTCVVSLVPSAVISYSVYSEETPVEDTDLMVASIPYPVLLETYKQITKKTSEMDEELISKLHKIGFRTHSGDDGTGFQLLYLRGNGGYYIDVGCCDLLIEKKIGLINAEDTGHFVPQGLKMRDGRVIPLDLVVLATGFETIDQNVRRLLGDEVADRIGPTWGFDDQGNIRNIWSRTPQPGLWLMGGAILEARLNSRFLALQIRASLSGLLPDEDNLPLARLPQPVRNYA